MMWAAVIFMFMFGFVGLVGSGPYKVGRKSGLQRGEFAPARETGKPCIALPESAWTTGFQPQPNEHNRQPWSNKEQLSALKWGWRRSSGFCYVLPSDQIPEHSEQVTLTLVKDEVWQEEVEQVACQSCASYKDVCVDYKELNSPTRRTTVTKKEYCDERIERDWKGTGWYRIAGQAVWNQTGRNQRCCTALWNIRYRLAFRRTSNSWWGSGWSHCQVQLEKLYCRYQGCQLQHSLRVLLGWCSFLQLWILHRIKFAINMKNIDLKTLVTV